MVIVLQKAASQMLIKCMFLQ